MIRSERSRFTLSLLPAQDYPVIDSFASTQGFRIEERVFKRLLEKTQFAMAQQDVRYYLNGMLIEAREGKIRSVATDGHRLAVCEADVALPKDVDTQVILPRKAVLELHRLLQDSEKEINLEFTPNHLRLLFDETVFTSKLIDGRFPDYKKVIPDNERIVIADRERLRQALTRASILSNEKYRGIRFKLEENTLTLKAHNPEQEEAEEQVEVAYKEGEISIGFNVLYLLDVLGAITDEKVQIALSDSNSSAVIRGQETEDSEYVVMPMRL